MSLSIEIRSVIGSQKLMLALFPFIIFCSASTSVSAADLTQFFEANCLDCHDGHTQKAEINLEAMPEDWSKHSTVAQWERVLQAIENGEMPPKKKKQPDTAERAAATQALKKLLTERSPVGGTVLQRLNGVQYERTIQKLFGLSFRLPAGFPADSALHGFDTVAAGLILSPPLMEQYLELATSVADEVIPPPLQEMQVKPKLVELKPTDFSVSFEGSKLHGEGDAQSLRLVNRNEVMIRSSTWATRFEAKQSGEFDIRVGLSAYKPINKEPLIVHLLAVRSGQDFVSVKGLRKLAEIKIPTDGNQHKLEVHVILKRGETIAFYWANAPFGWNKNDDNEANKQLHNILMDPKLFAAWLKLGAQRGRSASESWRQLQVLMSSDSLNLNDPQLVNPPQKYSIVVQNELRDILENMFHDLGPGMDVHGVSVLGPLKGIEDETDKERQVRALRFLGERDGRSDAEWSTAILGPFLTRAFRRPVDKEKLEKFTRLTLEHIAAGNRFESGIHIAIRAALVSPEFLYLCTKSGKLDDFDLATRLSYFLTSGPPDQVLFGLACSGKLSDPKVLESETLRLMGKKGNHNDFVSRFTSQWLGTKKLAEIMPDPRLLKFLDKDRDALIFETEMFFSEILHNNRPLQDFIAPDFTFMNDRIARNIYRFKLPANDGTKDGTKSGGRSRDEMYRVSIPREGRIGGILGLASVMMSTANGVDTQPVLRGAWLLENVFGTPVPPPPKNVPAVSSNTAGSKTIRELLAAHKADSSCIACHAKIDPPGFALENFDPVGRWRDFYPEFEKQADGSVVTKAGPPIDAASAMPDGTLIKDVTDLKRYLVERPDVFSRCLTSKLLTYATGRTLSYGDKLVVDSLVADVRKRGNGFTDLIIATVQSEVFRTR